MYMWTYEPEFTRPDLPIPLYPVNGLCDFMRRRFLLIADEYRCRSAFSATLAALIGTIVLAVISVWFPEPWQQVVADCAAGLGLYTAARVLALATFERQQHVFEHKWLASQTEVLRRHAFEALRCTVGGRRYDLARPSDVRDLQGQVSDKRTAVAFIYLASDMSPAIAEVHRDMRELTFLPGWASPGRAFVRFPEARYLARPRPRLHPARRTSWALDGPVLIAVSEDSAVASGAGTRSSH
jgi:hypothetical protein